MRITTSHIVSFHRALTDYYYQSGRHDMLWRHSEKNGHFDPYKIFISEVMLQQTQVDRVTPKYTQFLHKFPTVHDLAAVNLSEVLKMWSGLGYNRRAKYIWLAAKMIDKQFAGQFPNTTKELQTIPGIGPNTAGAIMAYAYNLPVVFIETNIRTVIIHHFFKDKVGVSDHEIKEVLAKVLPAAVQKDVHAGVLNPREFYWAMMDYGSYLKKSVGNLSRASKHYTKQSKFQGSLRQLRGKVIKLLADGPMTVKSVQEHIADERIDDVLTALEREGMIGRHGSRVHLS
jgi:A/G-specific adenine glycosylase